MISEDQALAAYAAVEAAYTERRWPEVLSQGQALRDALEPDEDRLRPRLLLLEGHALLHGQADPQGAEELYRQVLRSGDASLRPWAEEALASLGDAATVADTTASEEPETTAPEVPADSFPFTAAAMGVAPAAMADAAMPWLDTAKDQAPQPARVEPTEVMVVSDPRSPIGSSRSEQELVLTLVKQQPEEPEADDPAELAGGLLRVQLE